MKLFKTIDEKFAELGFVKEKDDNFGVRYVRQIEEFNTTHVIALVHKSNGNHILQSYDMNLMDENKIGNVCVGLTMYEVKLCLKKMKEKGWKVKKK